MEIPSDLHSFVETSLTDASLQPLLPGFIKKCSELNLSLIHFGREKATDEDTIDLLARLHFACYQELYTPQSSREYIKRCIGYTGFHAFVLLEENGQAAAAKWVDNGEPYPHHVPDLLEEFSAKTGSNLLVYGVQIMTHPLYRQRGLAKGLEMLFMNFCKTVYGAEPLFVQKIADENVASQDTALTNGYSPVGNLTADGAITNSSGQPRTYYTNPGLLPYSPIAYRAHAPQTRRGTVTFFPGHPATPYMGRVAVFHSESPHEDLDHLSKRMLTNRANQIMQTVYEYRDELMLHFQEEIEGIPLDSLRLQIYQALNRLITVTDFSTIRSVSHWSEEQLFQMDVRIPRYFIGPDLAPSFLFANLYVLASHARKAGHDTVVARMLDSDLWRLTQIIKRSYSFTLTDLVDVGDHNLKIDMAALRRGSRNNQTTVYIKTDRLIKKLERLAWIADAREVDIDTLDMYDALGDR